MLEGVIYFINVDLSTGVNILGKIPYFFPKLLLISPYFSTFLEYLLHSSTPGLLAKIFSLAFLFDKR